MTLSLSAVDHLDTSRQKSVATPAWAHGVLNTKFLCCLRSFEARERERERETGGVPEGKERERISSGGLGGNR